MYIFLYGNMHRYIILSITIICMHYVYFTVCTLPLVFLTGSKDLLRGRERLGKTRVFVVFLFDIQYAYVKQQQHYFMSMNSPWFSFSFSLMHTYNWNLLILGPRLKFEKIETIAPEPTRKGRSYLPKYELQKITFRHFRSKHRLVPHWLPGGTVP